MRAASLSGETGGVFFGDTALAHGDGACPESFSLLMAGSQESICYSVRKRRVKSGWGFEVSMRTRCARGMQNANLADWPNSSLVSRS